MGSVRDFIYLDWERVRSYVAQLDRGVPETTTGGLTSDEGEAFGGELGLLGVAKLEKQQDVRYIRSASETRSLHHAIFSILEERLEKDDALSELDGSYADAAWTVESLNDKLFVRVTGTTRIVDYAAILDLLEGFGELVKLGHAGEKSALASRADLGGAERQRALQQLEKKHRDQLKEMNVLNLSQIASGIRSLYGSSIRVKFVPDLERSENLLVGTVTRENLDESLMRTIGARGMATNHGWTALVQLDMSAEVPEQVNALPTGNTMEDSLDSLVARMDDLTKTVSGTTWPAATCIPIAIYRRLPIG